MRLLPFLLQLSFLCFPHPQQLVLALTISLVLIFSFLSAFYNHWLTFHLSFRFTTTSVIQILVAVSFQCLSLFAKLHILMAIFNSLCVILSLIQPIREGKKENETILKLKIYTFVTFCLTLKILFNHILLDNIFLDLYFATNQIALSTLTF